MSLGVHLKIFLFAVNLEKFVKSYDRIVLQSLFSKMAFNYLPKHLLLSDMCRKLFDFSLLHVNVIIISASHYVPSQNIFDLKII
jgi:hypothetical protein